ncbi:MAG TPA: ASCH domain-containing protein [Candidatus Bathyarchaeia archaeon]|nr:ASCH domain-containing protein [Candidatus Bathyarchaeia archaeon]
MDISKKAADYWKRFRKESGITESFVDAWSFGENPKLADELLRLVLTGKKTGTATLVIELEKKREKMPKVGDYNVILDGKGEPAAIIKTASVVVKPFNEVEAAFAYSEGEDDRTLESWRREHWKYWTRLGRKLGFTMKEDLLVICENFELVYPK